MSQKFVVLAAVLTVAAAAGQFYVPRAYYTIDHEGHVSPPVPLRRLRRSVPDSFYPGSSAEANANANSWGGGSAHADAEANSNSYSGVGRSIGVYPRRPLYVPGLSPHGYGVASLDGHRVPV